MFPNVTIQTTRKIIFLDFKRWSLFNYPYFLHFSNLVRWKLLYLPHRVQRDRRQRPGVGHALPVGCAFQRKCHRIDNLRYHRVCDEIIIFESLLTTFEASGIF